MRTKVNIRSNVVFLIRFFLVTTGILVSFGVRAQQDPMYTQYMDNLSILNPAYAGSKGVLSVMAVARNQWVSMPGAPETRTIAFNSPVPSKNMGLGFSFLSDKIGVVKQSGLYVDYAYKLNFSGGHVLSLGLKGGIDFYQAGVAELQTNDPNDPVFAQDINRSFLPNLGVGAFFSCEKYYIGISAPKLIENKISATGYSTQTVSREQIHLFFMSGYVFDINGIVKFRPSVLTKFVVNAPVSFDVTGTFLFYNKLWLGAMYRLDDSFGGLFQLQVTDNLKIGYSYDWPINQLGAYNNGTHEIMVTYDFDFGGRKARRLQYF